MKGKPRPRGLTLRESFAWFQPGEPPPPGEVWIWRGGNHHSFGYGQFWFEGKPITAPRAAWLIWRGEIPQGMVIRHMNDIPQDCNPWNLELGTNQENTQDRTSRGRGRSPGSPRRFSSEQEAEIAARYTAGETQVSIAESLGCAQMTVSKIVHRNGARVPRNQRNYHPAAEK